MNARQIYHITDIAICFGLSSAVMKEIMKKLMQLNNDELNKIWDILFERITNRHYLSIDIVYMIYSGNYNRLYELEILVRFLGLNGVVFATLITTAFISYLRILVILFKRYFKNKPWDYLKHLISRCGIVIAAGILTLLPYCYRL